MTVAQALAFVLIFIYPDLIESVFKMHDKTKIYNDIRDYTNA